MELNKIYNGDALNILKTFPDECIDMCITSPPYWGLRDYGVDGQLGLEKDFNEYIDKLCTIFDEVKRTLKDSGTCWVNIGDSYSSTRWSNSPSTTGKSGKHSNIILTKEHSLPDKSLIGIPFRFALEMINRGWILRNTIIWHKPNCMPSSVKDRFTVDFEYLFFFSKNKKYYFEQQFEESAGDWTKKGGAILNDTGWHKGAYKSPPTVKDLNKLDGSKRNKRTVWNISTKPYKDAHFAVYPPELIETPIKAGCPEFICNKCETPRIRIYEFGKDRFEGGSDKAGRTKEEMANSGKWQGKDVGRIKLGPIARERKQIGYSNCNCNEGFHPGVVLDPFIGSGTTAAVSKRLNKNYIGIELNPDYIPLINERLKSVQKVLV